MTVYFDNVARELNRFDEEYGEFGDDGTLAERLEELEKRVVLAVTLCAEWPGCPPKIRTWIHRIVLEYAPTAQVRGCVKRPSCDYADTAAAITGISAMCSALHTAFHALASQRIVGFNDSPNTPIMHLAGIGDDTRESMSEPDIDWWRRAIAEYEESERPAAYKRVAARAYAWTIYRTNGDEAAALLAYKAALAAVQAPAGT